MVRRRRYSRRKSGPDRTDPPGSDPGTLGPVRGRACLMVAAAMVLVGAWGIYVLTEPGSGNIPQPSADPDSKAGLEPLPSVPSAPERMAQMTGSTEYAGSASCRECHERFYELWAPSRHGLAMRPFTSGFAAASLSPQSKDITIGKMRYRAKFDANGGRVLERGPDGARAYEMVHAMGGKNVYYFLTPMAKGRLQVLPVAYDVKARAWYGTAGSAVRHFHDGPEDAPLHWTDRLYTFNTSCFSCHVSQLTRNYDLKTDAYRTVWREPGINCETCHGPSAEHVRVCMAAPEGKPPKDLKIIITKGFTPAQHNATCSSCHAKMVPLTSSFTPGEEFFDHYDLTTLEHPDFYPDGRDLGENYTYTTWRMSPCVEGGKLHCVHCHTSSGRYRFGEENANEACGQCHSKRVENAAQHTHHKPRTAERKTPRCVDCHMPTTRFAQMMRSDHSMRPPTPAATLRFKSPNACNLCHTKPEEDAAWADKNVRKWHDRDYQAPILRVAELIAAARKSDWRRLPEMLQYITNRDRDEVFAASLIRLMQRCCGARQWPAMLGAMRDPSPLVRSAAAARLGARLTPESVTALLAATGDRLRLVRIRAAGALAALGREQLAAVDSARLAKATQELEHSQTSRPDDWSSHYNLGNLFLDRGKPAQALDAYTVAARLRPDTILPLVNASMAHARMGRADLAEKSLRRALEIDPASPAAHFNLALLKAEQGDNSQAERSLRAALAADPSMPQAAFNLGVLLSRTRLAEAIQWCRKAHKLQPEQPRYAYTLAFFLNESGDLRGAREVLEQTVKRHPGYADAVLLLGGIHERQGRIDSAKQVCRRALESNQLTPQASLAITGRLRALSPK